MRGTSTSVAKHCRDDNTNKEKKTKMMKKKKKKKQDYDTSEKKEALPLDGLDGASEAMRTGATQSIGSNALNAVQGNALGLLVALELNSNLPKPQRTALVTAVVDSCLSRQSRVLFRICQPPDRG